MSSSEEDRITRDWQAEQQKWQAEQQKWLDEQWKLTRDWQAEQQKWQAEQQKWQAEQKLGVANSSWPFYSSKLEMMGLTTPDEQYCLYMSVGVALIASRKPFMRAYWMNKYLHATDVGAKIIYAGRGRFSQAELNYAEKRGEQYLKELRSVPRRWALLPLSFVIVESARIAYKRFKSSKN
eukprot:TRINITY_DN1922_c0_g1_i5.p1 TRINITY_DN1922_c0_g1~~TRINITY_DN1922_c0_g1_i5.p1  ORF type:complete len:180 (-),score=18.63 TRINITY_DN1922_c0_g1_i5:61-600(-)